MKFNVSINIMPLDNLLDPQGKVVSSNMKNIGLPAISNVRIGKHITLQVDAANKAEAEQMADTACKKLLANLIMEKYSFEVTEA